MQKQQENTVVEFVSNAVSNYMRSVRSIETPKDPFMVALSFVYSLHKGYSISPDAEEAKLEGEGDQLLLDLLSNAPNESVFLSASTTLAGELSLIDKTELDASYVEILNKLYDKLAIQYHSRHDGDFRSPKEINQLIAHFVKKEDCKSVYDPFCGTASIIGELKKDGEEIRFWGQEINLKTSLLARVMNEAVTGEDTNITCGNSIVEWSGEQYDAVVSCPPLGVRMTSHERMLSEDGKRLFGYNTLGGMLISKSLSMNNPKVIAVLLPTSVLDSGVEFAEIRKYLVENNLIEAIINLPESILYGTGMDSVLLICKKDREANQPIKFFFAQNYLTGNSLKKKFDVQRFLGIVEESAQDSVLVDIEEVKSNDYSFNPVLYYDPSSLLKEGQQIYTLQDLIKPAKTLRDNNLENRDSINYLHSYAFSSDFQSILLNKNKFLPGNNELKTLSSINPDGAVTNYLIVHNGPLRNTRFALVTTSEEFCLSFLSMQAFIINTELVSPEYLVYAILNNEDINLSNVRFSAGNLSKISIIVDTKEKQKTIIEEYQQDLKRKLEDEREKEDKRLGINRGISDLVHMLSTTRMRIDQIISKLERNAKDEESALSIKSLKDNVGYMNRIIEFSSTNFSSSSFLLKDTCINQFLSEYTDSWKNYGGGIFDLILKDSTEGNISIPMDKPKMTVLLDSILTNAYRHGFHKKKSYTENNTVQIQVSQVEFQEKSFVLLSVANNGDPIPEGFTVNDYMSKGRYTSSSGRSGLGGYHVYQIAKGHGGYINLDSNKEWNVIVEVLLPMKDFDPDIKLTYERNCI